MNWTGGRLNRHTKNNDRGLKAQKQHFAKASLNHRKAALPTDLSHHPKPPLALSQPPRRQSYRLGVQHASSKLEHSNSCHGSTAQFLARQRSSRTFGENDKEPSIGLTFEDHTDIEEKIGDDPREARKKLLNKADWLALIPLRPLNIHFPSTDEMTKIGRHRKLAKFDPNPTAVPPSHLEPTTRSQLGKRKRSLEPFSPSDISCRSYDDGGGMALSPSLALPTACILPVHALESDSAQILSSDTSMSLPDLPRPDQDRAHYRLEGRTSAVNEPSPELLCLGKARSLGLGSFDDIQARSFASSSRSTEESDTRRQSSTVMQVSQKANKPTTGFRMSANRPTIMSLDSKTKPPIFTLDSQIESTLTINSSMPTDSLEATSSQRRLTQHSIEPLDNITTTRDFAPDTPFNKIKRFQASPTSPSSLHHPGYEADPALSSTNSTFESQQNLNKSFAPAHTIFKPHERSVKAKAGQPPLAIGSTPQYKLDDEFNMQQDPSMWAAWSPYTSSEAHLTEDQIRGSSSSISQLYQATGRCTTSKSSSMSEHPCCHDDIRAFESPFANKPAESMMILLGSCRPDRALERTFTDQAMTGFTCSTPEKRQPLYIMRQPSVSAVSLEADTATPKLLRYATHVPVLGENRKHGVVCRTPSKQVDQSSHRFSKSTPFPMLYSSSSR